MPKRLGKQISWNRRLADRRKTQTQNYGFSFDATKKFGERVKLNASTAFYLYRYNLNLGNESDNVQTYYAGLDWNFYDGLTTKARYELENNEYDNFHTLKLSLIWNF